jgi:hypothetical protein
LFTHLTAHHVCLLHHTLLQVKDLVELVQKARWNKIMAGLATLQGAITVKLNNLAAMEINAGEG